MVSIADVAQATYDRSGTPGPLLLLGRVHVYRYSNLNIFIRSTRVPGIVPAGYFSQNECSYRVTLDVHVYRYRYRYHTNILWPYEYASSNAIAYTIAMVPGNWYCTYSSRYR